MDAQTNGSGGTIGRYARQMLLEGFGQEGQDRLGASHAMIIGMGALGCPAADLLVRAGVGRVSIVDRDVVELSNLQRQTLFDERDARERVPKAEAAARRLRGVNSGVRIEAIVEHFSPENAERLLRPHPKPGVVLDCTDNFATRYLINDACVKVGVPLVYAGAVASAGMAMTIVPTSAPTCDTAGIFAPVSSIVASVQASEAIKVLLRRLDLLSNTLLSMDLWSNERRRISLAGARREDCPCCGRGEFEFLSGRGAQDARTMCGRGAVQVAGHAAVDLRALAARLRSVAEVRLSAEHLTATIEVATGAAGNDGVREAASRFELTVFADGRAIVGGTTDPAIARSVYARFIGL
jgi:adenylyltransferase/sulfurtransferase